MKTWKFNQEFHFAIWRRRLKNFYYWLSSNLSGKWTMKFIFFPSTQSYNQAIFYILGRLYVIFFFSDELRKFTISDFPKQINFGHILITLFFPTPPSNQSTLHQNVFVLAALTQVVGWNTMSKCGSIRGWRKKIKWSICVQMCPLRKITYDEFSEFIREKKITYI